jgi:HTH-type transcriptional regulator/antitoxin HipB
MNDFTIKTQKQLGAVLRGFRTSKKLSQQAVGMRAALPQPIISNIESNSGRIALSRLLKVLAALDLELVVKPKNQQNDSTEW